MIGGEVHPHRGRLDHTRRHQLAQLGQCGHRVRVPAQVRGDHQRVRGGQQRAGQLVGDLRRQRRRGHRRPPRRLVRLRRHLFFQYLAGGGQVDRAGWLAPRDLQRAVGKLRGGAAAPDLLRVLDVAADQPGLIGGVLQPVDELGAAARQLPLLGHRRQPGQDQHRHPVPGGVVHGTAEVLGAAVDVHQHSLRLAGDLGVTLGRAERDELVRADHQFRQFAGDTVLPGPGIRLDDPGVVAAEVGEQIADARRADRCQQRPARRAGPASRLSHRPRMSWLRRPQRSFAMVAAAMAQAAAGRAS